MVHPPPPRRGGVAPLHRCTIPRCTIYIFFLRNTYRIYWRAGVLCNGTTVQRCNGTASRGCCTNRNSTHARTNFPAYLARRISVVAQRNEHSRRERYRQRDELRAASPIRLCCVCAYSVRGINHNCCHLVHTVISFVHAFQTCHLRRQIGHGHTYML